MGAAEVVERPTALVGQKDTMEQAYPHHEALAAVSDQNPGLPEHNAGIRADRELLLAPRPFETESVARSW